MKAKYEAVQDNAKSCCLTKQQLRNALVKKWRRHEFLVNKDNILGIYQNFVVL
jgi:lambda repressor-like predicted transcriptional regulator